MCAKTHGHNWACILRQVVAKNLLFNFSRHWAGDQGEDLREWLELCWEELGWISGRGSYPRAASGTQKAPQKMVTAPRLPEPQQFRQCSQGCGFIVVSCAGTGVGLNGPFQLRLFHDSMILHSRMLTWFPRGGRCYPRIISVLTPGRVRASVLPWQDILSWHKLSVMRKKYFKRCFRVCTMRIVFYTSV